MRAAALLLPALGLFADRRAHAQDSPKVELDAAERESASSRGLREIAWTDAVANFFSLGGRPGGPGKIAVVIATHDRIGYVQLCAMALKGTVPEEDIYVIDDSSTEYSVEDLQQWFGASANVVEKPHMGAGIRTNHAMKFIHDETDYEYMAILDSDLIVEPNWRTRVLEALKAEKDTEPVWFSMYHSALHPTLGCGEQTCRMKDLGYAGSVYSRSFLGEVLPNVQASAEDWGVVAYCNAHQIPFHVLKDSAVQHVGMHGTHGSASEAEKAVGFPLGSMDEKLQRLVGDFLAGTDPQKLVFSSSKGRYVAGAPAPEAPNLFSFRLVTPSPDGLVLLPTLSLSF